MAKVLPMWPTPETVADRWNSARLRITLSLRYGHPSQRRRARILAARAL